MLKAALLFILMVPPAFLQAQATFPELVERALGSDQELINGIQFSNHYGRFEGHPYFLDGRFRAGRVNIRGRWHEGILLRYNLYSQKVEMEYRTLEGNRNQIMTVPELMPAFLLEGIEFRRMEFPETAPAYYQCISLGSDTCYVAWNKNLEPAQSNYKSGQFASATRQYWLKLEDRLISFDTRKTFLEAFPPHLHKELNRLLKQQQFSFKQATASEVESLILAAFRQYQNPDRP